MVKHVCKSLNKGLPQRVRVSLGSAIVLGFWNGKVDASPTTAYLMTYREGRCSANCGFCPQARESNSREDMLSRISWPVFPTESVLDGLRSAFEGGKINRVCIQALNYPGVFSHLRALVNSVSERTKMPISVSCQPLDTENMKLLKGAGAERIGIPLDAATEELFDKVKGKLAKGPYSWNRQFELLKEAVNVFGKGKVSTHFIIGLGETEREMISAVQKCLDIGVLPGLFAFTPVQGTALESNTQPSLQRYRRIQLARHLILRKMSNVHSMVFDEKSQITAFGAESKALMKIVRSGKPFLTSGCPDCNRPYYNEKPSGPIYNYPKKPTKKDLGEIENQFNIPL
jgi:biotin synthase-related radical SAM superfamily protein